MPDVISHVLSNEKATISKKIGFSEVYSCLVIILVSVYLILQTLEALEGYLEHRPPPFIYYSKEK